MHTINTLSLGPSNRATSAPSISSASTQREASSGVRRAQDVELRIRAKVLKANVMIDGYGVALADIDRVCAVARA